MESDDVLLTCDREPTAYDADSDARGYTAPGKRARQIGFGSWRDPYRTAS